MKTSILAVLLFIGCTNSPPDYQAPTLVSPADGSTFAEFVTLEWLPNNNADRTTTDYSFFVEVATDTEFKNIKASFLTKLETKYYAPYYAFRNGVNFWRVTAEYKQQNGGSTVVRSVVRAFTYTGNDGAVYVDPATAGAAVLGTKAEPVKTISKAFDIASRRGLNSIRLANATYAETIGTSFSGTIKGCYSAATWVRNVGTCSTTLTDAAAVAYYQPGS